MTSDRHSKKGPTEAGFELGYKLLA